MQNEIVAFLTVMSTLSAASQMFVKVLINNFLGWLNAPPDTGHKPTQAELRKDQLRVAWIHVLTAVCGSLLTWICDLKPLDHLGIAAGKPFNIVAAGFLVSFGGGFFNDLLGVFNEMKKAQRALKEQRLARAQAYRDGKLAAL